MMRYNPAGKFTGKLSQSLSKTKAGRIALASGKLGANMASEAFEEGWQGWASLRGIHEAEYGDNAQGQMEFLNEYLGSEEFKENAIGGAFGGGFFHVLGGAKNKGLDYFGKKRRANTYASYKEDLDKVKVLRTQRMFSMVKQLEDPNIPESEKVGIHNALRIMQAQSNQSNALENYHLDQVFGQEGQSESFDGYVEQLKSELVQAEADPESKNAKHIAATYPTFIEEANRAKTIYDEASEKHGASNALDIAINSMQNETSQSIIDEANQTIESASMADGFNRLDTPYQSLYKSTQKKTALETVIADLIEQKKTVKSKKEKEIIQNQIDSYTEKIAEIDQQSQDSLEGMSDADKTRNENQLSSIIGNTDLFNAEYQKAYHESQIQINNAKNSDLPIIKLQQKIGNQKLQEEQLAKADAAYQKHIENAPSIQ